jgi:TolB-like protein/Flp pilus assembly protein TadD
MSGEAPESGAGPPPTDPPAAVQVPNASIHVFISYASQDAAVAGALVEALERHGVGCWIAPRDVKAGALYADAIVRAISGAKAIVLVLSESSIASSHVGKEIERASSKKRPIIALRIDAAPLTPALEYFLSESQWVEAQTGSMEAAYAKLIDDIRDPARTAPRKTPAAPLEVAAATARAAHPKLRFKWILLAAGAVFVVAALLVYKFWISSHVAQERPVATSSLAPAAGAPAQPTISEKSIAVLPFVDMSEKKDQEYFADGMAEEIIDLLAKIPSLTVIGRTSSFQFKGKTEDLRLIGAKLAAAYVLEGSVRKSGDHVRVTAQLISTQTGAHQWSDTYDQQVGDVLKMQDEIAAGLVRALQVTVGADDLQSRPKLKSVEAYDLYLRGRHAYDRYDEAGTEAAVGYFQQALERDPSLIPAAEWLAIAHEKLPERGIVPPREGYEQARASVERALKLDPQSGMMHGLLADIHAIYDWDWTAAVAEGKRALALAPRDSVALTEVGQVYEGLGQWDEATRLYTASLALDPLFPAAHFLLGTVRSRTGQYAEAEVEYREVAKISPTWEAPHFYLGWTLLAEGRLEAALAEMQQSGDSRDLGLAAVYYAMGRKAESDAALARYTKQHADDDAYDIAMVHAYRAEPDVAFAWLDRAYRQKDPTLYGIKSDPPFKNIEPDPRYKAFLRKMNLPE